MTKTSISIAIASLLSASVGAESLKSVSLEESVEKPKQETVRVIVTHESGVVFSQGVSVGNNQRILEVEADEAGAFIKQMKNRQGVKNAEQDVIIKREPVVEDFETTMQRQSYTPTDSPTDPFFSSQRLWDAPGTSNPGTQNIISAYLNTTRETESVRVGVIDSDFITHPDLEYAEGYNFASFGGGVVGPNFLEVDQNEDCTSTHGTGVAGVIASMRNNGVGTAGIMDAELVAVRALNCGTGSLFEAAQSIRWLAGGSVSGEPSISEPVRVINLSLVAEILNCPTYMQEAVDFAQSKDILVVASAGNNSADAGGYSPANCAGVLTVGSLRISGAVSGFSNYGTVVDVSAVGSQVATITTDPGSAAFRYGTSFSAPVVAGIAGMMMQAFPGISSADVAQTITATMRSQTDPDNQEEVGGIADADAALEVIRNRLDDQRPDLRLALNSPERCERSTYLQNEPSGLRFDSLYEVLASNIDLNGSSHYAVFKNPGSTTEEVTLSENPVFLVQNIDPDNDDLYFDLCDSDGNNCQFSKQLPL
jgi:hypothetical protein